MNDEELKEFEKISDKDYKHYIYEIKIAGVIVILLIILLAAFLFFNQPQEDRRWMIPAEECGETNDPEYVELCGELDIEYINFNHAMVLSDGKVVCTFDNGEPTQLYNYETSTWDTNPNYKVCYKVFNYKGKWGEGVWAYGGKTC